MAFWGWLAVTVVGALSAMALGVGGLFFWTFPATDFTNVEYVGQDGTTLYAYLASPPSEMTPGTAPAAILFHAWNGMSEEATYFADRLAEVGYYVIAPDLFRNKASASWNLPRNIANVAGANQTRMDHDTDAALAYLLSLGKVDEDKIVSGPGFCFGGSQALYLAQRRPTMAVVTLYGTYIEELADPQSDNWGLIGVNNTVLGIYGNLDSAPSPEEANMFAAALQERGVDHNVTVYEGVGHAFVTPHAHRSGDATVVSAWNEVVGHVERARATTASRNTTARRLEKYAAHALGGHHHHFSRSAKKERTLWHHRVLCAVKCVLGMFAGTGHLQHRGLPTIVLESFLVVLLLMQGLHRGHLWLREIPATLPRAYKAAAPHCDIPPTAEAVQGPLAV